MISSKKNPVIINEFPETFLDDFVSGAKENSGWDTVRRDFVESIGHRLKIGNEILSNIKNEDITFDTTSIKNNEELLNYIVQKNNNSSAFIIKNKNNILDIFYAYSQNYEGLFNKLLSPINRNLELFSLFVDVKSENATLDLSTGILSVEYSPILVKNAKTLAIKQLNNNNVGTINFDLKKMSQLLKWTTEPKGLKPNTDAIISFETEFTELSNILTPDSFENIVKNLTKTITKKFITIDLLWNIIVGTVKHATQFQRDNLIRKAVLKKDVSSDAEQKLSNLLQWLAEDNIIKNLENKDILLVRKIILILEKSNLIEVNRLTEIKNQLEIKNQREIQNQPETKEDQPKIKNQPEIKNQLDIKNQPETKNQPDIKEIYNDLSNDTFYRTYLSDEVRKQLAEANIQPSAKLRAAAFFGVYNFLLPSASGFDKFLDVIGVGLLVVPVKNIAKVFTELLPNYIANGFDRMANSLENNKRPFAAKLFNVLAAPFKMISFVGRAITSPIRGIQAGQKQYREGNKLVGAINIAASAVLTGVAYGAAFVFAFPFAAAFFGFTKAASLVSVLGAKAVKGTAYLLGKLSIELGIAVGVSSIITGTGLAIENRINAKRKEKSKQEPKGNKIGDNIGGKSNPPKFSDNVSIHFSVSSSSNTKTPNKINDDLISTSPTNENTQNIPSNSVEINKKEDIDENQNSHGPRHRKIG